MAGTVAERLRNWVRPVAALVVLVAPSAARAQAPAVTAPPAGAPTPAAGAPRVPPPVPGVTAMPSVGEHSRPGMTGGSGVVAWPGLATPSQPPPPPTVLEDTRYGVTHPPPATIPAYTDAELNPAPRQPLPPLPGSLEDEAARWYDARRGFHVCTWRDTAITAAPYSLLWEPPLASKREPRFLVNPTTLDNPGQSWTLDTSIGNTVGLLRAQPVGHDVAYQLDIFGVVHTRLTPEDLDAADYRFGVPLTARWGAWHGKLAYEHTSAHLGDEFLRRNPGTPVLAFARDEVVLGVGRWVRDRLRVYGQLGYAFFSDLPFGTPDDAKWRFDTGFEVYCPAPTGLSGQPFFAAHLNSLGYASYNPNVNVQAGWMWRNPYQRLSNVRLYGEYYNGRSPYGQFYQTREEFYSVGWSCDY